MTPRHSPSRRTRPALLVAGLCAVLATLPVAAGELRIGYVNAVRVIEEAPQGVAALKKIEAEFGPRDRELVALQGRIRGLEEAQQKGGAALPETERRSHEREILALKRELKRATQEFHEDHNQRRNEELAALQQVIRKAIVDIARQERYDLVLHEGVLYASDAVDITEKVLRKLGKP